MRKVPGKQKDVSPDRRLGRRDFLRMGSTAAALGTVGLLAGNRVFGSPDVRTAAGAAVKYGMVIDLNRCFGCRACMEACKVENNTPAAIFWMHTFRLEAGEYPNTRIWFLPRPCMHCDNPPCVKVCPVGATYKDSNGRVLQDSKRCIGCRFCIQACPYGARYYNDREPRKNYYLDWDGPHARDVGRATNGAVPPYKNPELEKLYPVGLAGFEGKEAPLAGGGKVKGVVEKCTFCLQRVEKGLKPACVANCPVQALHFGDLNDPESDVSKLLAQKRPFRLLEEMGTNPKVFYVGQAPTDIGAREFSPIIKRAEHRLVG